MSKKKFGLSFLVAMAMMLVFSISAMAAGVTGLKANVENNTLRATWAALADASLYKVTVTDITNPTAKVVVGVADTVVTAPNTSYEIAVSPSKKYEVKVTSDSATATDAVTVEVWAPASNSALAEGDETADNNIGNANNTGTGAAVEDGTKAIGQDGVIKSGGMVKNDGTTGTHRTHGEYQNNTNSCASCHQTHTGASKALLFKDGVYNTCTACHDGTLGMYNVFEHSSAGTFGGTETGNMSVHLADGSVQVKAAPGGNLSANSGAWVNEFNCASCHSPHGSYSDRLLHYNPNGMGRKAPAEGGIGLVNSKVWAGVSSVPLDGTVKEAIVRDTAANLGITEIEATAKAIAVMKFVPADTKKGIPAKFERTTTPWLYGYDYANPNKNYYTRFWVTETNTSPSGADLTLATVNGVQHYAGVVDNHDQDWNTDLHIVWGKGYIYTTSTDTILDNLTKANIARAYTVNLDLVEFAKFGDANGVPIYKSDVNTLYSGKDALGNAMDAQGQPWKGAGVQMSTYCASCHTDYLAHSGSATGTFNTAYRHSTDSDSYTCVRCHFAHGTDVTVMLDAEGRDLATITTDFGGDAAKATNYLKDQNPSSALKRYTNMSVCWGCHTDSKAEQLKNTSSYDKSEDPHGLENAQPVTPGAIKDANSDGVVVNGN